MPASDSDDEVLEEFELDLDEDAEPDIDDVAPDDASEEGDDESASEDSEDASEEEDDDDDDDDDDEPVQTTMEMQQLHAQLRPEPQFLDVDQTQALPVDSRSPTSTSPHPAREHTPPRSRPPSPAHLRRLSLLYRRPDYNEHRPLVVEAICALPHPVPTHALASSLCMTHLITGSDDGYVRDYDIFGAVNGKIFLSAPQRHHAGVVEGLMKAGQLRFWWENPALKDNNMLVNGRRGVGDGEDALAPVYSLAMHSDALWALAGTDWGHINLCTVRHDPGRLVHVMNGHRGHVSALSMDYDEKGFLSAGWDGEAIQWDLNNGQIVRHFTSHGAQLAGIAVRPQTTSYAETGPPVVTRSQPGVTPDPDPNLPTNLELNSESGGIPAPGAGPSGVISKQLLEEDVKSDASDDSLFDGEPEEPNIENTLTGGTSGLNLPGAADSQEAPSRLPPPPPPPPPPKSTLGFIPPSKNAPPLLDPAGHSTYSPDILMTASIDGQVILWDRRVNTPGKGVGRLWMSEKTPPWCLSACWSADGAQIFAGRRNGTVDVWDIRQLGQSGPSNNPRLLKTLRNPLSSGVVSCVAAFPDCRHIASASVDNLRLWNVAEAGEPDSFGKSRSGVQFKIIPGHHGGYISQMLIDAGSRFLVSASSNRGWHGESTRTVFVHDIKYS